VTDDDKKRFLELMSGCASTYSKQIEKSSIAIFWDFLSDYDIGDVDRAFRLHLRFSKYFPTIAEIIEHIPNANAHKHVGADEAWVIAKQAMDPSNSVCATDEILQAMDIAQQVYNYRDENPARMAFREAYNRIVKNSATKPQWFMSIGEDKSQAESVALKAVQLGRLPAGTEVKHRIEAPTTSVTALIEGYVAKVNVRKDHMENIKKMLVVEKTERFKISLSDDEFSALPWYLKEVVGYE
jgi:hypothetical protein